MNLTDSVRLKPLKVLGVSMTGDNDIIARRLMELGFIKGAIVEIRHEAPILKDPIAINVRGMIVALRRYEAERVQVEAVPDVKHIRG